jgi:hypothetical protein
MNVTPVKNKKLKTEKDKNIKNKKTNFLLCPLRISDNRANKKIVTIKK